MGSSGLLRKLLNFPSVVLEHAQDYFIDRQIDNEDIRGGRVPLDNLLFGYYEVMGDLCGWAAHPFGKKRVIPPKDYSWDISS